MSPWLAAVGAGVALTLLQYGWRRGSRGPLGIVALAMRFLAVTLVVALLLDATVGRPRPVSRWAALDVSASMARGDGAVWRAAVDSIRAAAPESVLVFGDSVRSTVPDHPSDAGSVMRPVADRALAAGHPVVVATDGELPDPEALEGLPAGSRVIVISRPATSDAAIASFDMPRAAVSGDTVAARLVIAAGAVGSGAGSATIRLDDRTVTTMPFDALPAYGSRSMELRVPVDGPPGATIVEAVITASGDQVPRNDTLAVALDRSRSAGVVFVSTSPDFDSRAAIGLLRGALALPVQGFLRIAPGVWRVEGSLGPVAEAAVRAALRDAPVAILHGDTAVFGSPASATRAPYALIVPVTDTAGEWYVTGTPVSPLTAAYSGIAWDSLPPLLAAGPPPAGAWTAMQVSEARVGSPRALVTGTDLPRRTATIVAGGLWRWQFRGGSSADAFAAFWGGIFDWLAGDRADQRAAIPDAGSFRAGDRIRWRRGSAADSVVEVSLRRRNGPRRADSLTLRFGAGTTVLETPAMAEGVYDVSVRGGSSALVVNPSAEWLPRAVRIKSGEIRAGSATGAVPRLRDYVWIYALVIAALCVEWLVRRKIGLR